ncbi:MAG: proteasome ATPase [Desulfomonilaceae bacterium]|nr:proteasome ATPase [Desulfomonilaceae bacterium]
MAHDEKSGRSDHKRDRLSKRRQVVDRIVREADAHTPPKSEANEAEMEARYRESEKKRLLLAEALHQSRLEMRNIMPNGDRNPDRAYPYGVFVQQGREDNTVVIKHHGRLYEAKVIPKEEESDREERAKGTFHAIREIHTKRRRSAEGFRKGEYLLLDNDLQVIEARGFELVCGSLAHVQQVLSDEKLLVKTVGDETIILTRAEPLASVKILAGDNIEYDPESLFAYGILPKHEVDRLVLEKVPDVRYSDIGGLDEAIELMQEAIELPHLYPEYYREYQLVPPKGILLYGPPGCGKTLLAKAVANNLAKRIEEETGERKQSYFLNVKGPELLNKYVGETEQAIRDLFARARNQASGNTPVIIFFDEMDSMFRVRGSGISSDMESTIVPQFLAELDGLESLENVIVIGATNREDLIDPAILRPGRLDRKIRIPRPDKAAAKEIFSKYLKPDLPFDPLLTNEFADAAAAAAWMIDQISEEMYSLKPENELLEITYADGTRTVLYLKDFAGGAIIEHIVNRAKLAAVKDLIGTGKRGITLQHLFSALRKEYEENEELPSNTNPSEWYRIIGKGGERVVRVRSVFRKGCMPQPPECTRQEVLDPADCFT